MEGNWRHQYVPLIWPIDYQVYELVQMRGTYFSIRQHFESQPCLLFPSSFWRLLWLLYWTIIFWYRLLGFDFFDWLLLTFTLYWLRLHASVDRFCSRFLSLKKACDVIQVPHSLTAMVQLRWFFCLLRFFYLDWVLHIYFFCRNEQLLFF